MSPVTKLLLLWLLLLSFAAVVATVYDKWAATHRPRARVRESTLLLLGLLGGSAAEYLTMRLIRHKTRHRKFMWGLPAILLLQGALICALYLLL